MTIKRWYWRRVILPPRPLLIVPCLCWAQCAPPQQAFILRAAPLNCPHCSDLNVCVEQNPFLLCFVYPDLCSPGWFWGGLIKRGRLRPSTPGPASAWGPASGYNEIWQVRNLSSSFVRSDQQPPTFASSPPY